MVSVAVLSPSAQSQVLFGPKTDFATGDGPHAVAIADFNGDGRPDLAIAEQLANTVSVLLGAGDGTFGTRTPFGTGNAPPAVATGDINNDGNLDLVAPNYNSCQRRF